MSDLLCGGHAAPIYAPRKFPCGVVASLLHACGFIVANWGNAFLNFALRVRREERLRAHGIALEQKLSFPRRRESIFIKIVVPQALRWIPAFAGMTGRGRHG